LQSVTGLFYMRLIGQWVGNLSRNWRVRKALLYFRLASHRGLHPYIETGLWRKNAL
jgi:hypothetical protein